MLPPVSVKMTPSVPDGLGEGLDFGSALYMAVNTRHAGTSTISMGQLDPGTLQLHPRGLLLPLRCKTV